MDTIMRYQDILEGASKYLQWKVRIRTILKENKLWDFSSTTVTPPSSDPIVLDLHEVKEAKS